MYWSSIFVILKQILEAVDDTIRQFVWSNIDMKKSGEKSGLGRSVLS